jgi:DNA-binding MarR family transcriptional regulator
MTAGGASNGPEPQDQHERVVNGFQSYAAGQSELGREFARRMKLHVTDSAAIVEILRAEDRGNPLTPARLAARIGLTSGATSILLNRLERAGHITRVRGHADRRKVTLHSARPVHTAADEFFAPLAARLGELMDRYSPEQLHLIETFVTEFRDIVDGYARPDDD